MHLPLLLLLPLPSHPPTCTHPSTHPLPGCLQAAEDEAETYYDALKRGMAERAAKTKAALDALDPGTRVAMEVRAALCCPGLPAWRCCRGGRGWGGGGVGQWLGLPQVHAHLRELICLPTHHAGPPPRRVCAPALLGGAL